MYNLVELLGYGQVPLPPVSTHLQKHTMTNKNRQTEHKLQAE